MITVIFAVLSRKSFRMFFISCNSPMITDPVVVFHLCVLTCPPYCSFSFCGINFCFNRGLIYRMIEPKIVLLIFVSGKVVITGAKKRSQIRDAFNNIYHVLSIFRKVSPPADS